MRAEQRLTHVVIFDTEEILVIPVYETVLVEDKKPRLFARFVIATVLMVLIFVVTAVIKSL